MLRLDLFARSYQYPIPLLNILLLLKLWIYSKLKTLPVALIPLIRDNRTLLLCLSEYLHFSSIKAKYPLEKNASSWPCGTPSWFQHVVPIGRHSGEQFWHVTEKEVHILIIRGLLDVGASLLSTRVSTTRSWAHKTLEPRSDKAAAFLIICSKRAPAGQHVSPEVAHMI